MNNARLLHAAARGARIQEYHFRDEVWFEATGATLQEYSDPEYLFRVHPDDEHLQYGPISSALRFRFASEWTLAELNDSGWPAAWEYVKAIFPGDTRIYGEEGYALAMLFLAEALADEGL